MTGRPAGRGEPRRELERELDETERRLLAGMGRGDDGRSTDIESGLGAPGWVARTLRHCTSCGGPLVREVPETEHRERAVCSSCGFIA